MMVPRVELVMNTATRLHTLSETSDAVTGIVKNMLITGISFVLLCAQLRIPPMQTLMYTEKNTVLVDPQTSALYVCKYVRLVNNKLELRCAKLRFIVNQL